MGNKWTKGIIKRDRNGNKVVSISGNGFKTFSIQTNGRLPECHRLDIGEEIIAGIDRCWYEIMKDIKKYGTERQKSLFAYTSAS